MRCQFPAIYNAITSPPNRVTRHYFVADWSANCLLLHPTVSAIELNSGGRIKIFQKNSSPILRTENSFMLVEKSKFLSHLLRIDGYCGIHRWSWRGWSDCPQIWNSQNWWVMRIVPNFDRGVWHDPRPQSTDEIGVSYVFNNAFDGTRFKSVRLDVALLVITFTEQ